MRNTIISALMLLGPGLLHAQPAPAAGGLREITYRLEYFAAGQHAYMYYGDELGIFAKAGFKLKILPGAGSSLSAKLIGGGSEDAGQVSSDYVLMGREKGLELKSIMTLYHKNPVVLYSLADKKIKSLKDLYGKRVGLSMETNTYPQYLGLCQVNGIDRSKIKEIPVKPDAAIRLMLSGEIDAHLNHTIGTPLAMKVSGHKVNMVLAADNGIDVYGMSVVAGPSLLKDPDAVSRLRKAVIESLDRTRADPKAAFAAMQKAVKLEKPELEYERLKLLLKWVYTPEARKLGTAYQTPEGWKATAETLVKTGQLKDASVHKDAFLN